MKRKNPPPGRRGLAVYPGSFDPLTRGHLDIIQRACRLFGQVVVAVSLNPSKTHTFSVPERVAMIEDAIRRIPNAEVDTYPGLIVDFLKKRQATILLRSIRVVQDMDYEYQLASMNRHIWSAVETVFLMADEQYTYLSSSMVKEIARLGGPVQGFVTPFVARQLARKLPV